jgi:hypothetical protein
LAWRKRCVSRALFARGPFRIDKQAEAVVKSELGVLAGKGSTNTV